MRVKVFRLLIIFQIFIQCMMLLNFNSITYASSNENEENIYDVILFWGQSNMVGFCSKNEENGIGYDPTNDNSVKEYSKESGISEDILKQNDPKVRNKVSITQDPNTVYEYKYLKDKNNENPLEEITENTESFGEDLSYNPDNTEEYKLKPETNLNKKSLNESKGTNLIPEFCRVYHKRTGRKVVAVSAAREGKPIKYFLPYEDKDNTVQEKELRIYESIKEKYNKAITYLNDNGYKIGRKIYVVFQGESNVQTAEMNNKYTKDDYKYIFNKVHTNLTEVLGIEKGTMIETARAAGTSMLDKVDLIHEAQEDIIREHNDIVLGSSFPYDKYIPPESEYESCTNKVAFDSNGNKLQYEDALKRARMCEDYPDNAIHFTSAALCQIGREAANNLADSLISPQLTIQYSTVEPTNQNVTVTITSNEKVQEVEGWTISNDKKVLTKVYTINCTESVTVYDLAGNYSNLSISIKNIDKIAPNINIEYSTTKITNKDVTVVLNSNEVIQEVDGWKLSGDRKVLTKIFENNNEEDVIIKDLVGNETKIKIEVKNIDKTIPKIDVEYNVNDDKSQVLVVIKSDKELQSMEGWVLSEDGKALTKVFYQNEEKEVLIYDIAGNSFKLDLHVVDVEEKTTEDKKEKEEKEEEQENSISNESKEDNIINTDSDKNQYPHILPKTGLTRTIIFLIFIFAINILYTYYKYKKLNG